MNANKYCDTMVCTEDEFRASGKCCEPVAGEADCCATCDSDLSCAMMVHGAGASCYLEIAEPTNISFDWDVERCVGAREGAAECYGVGGKCCKGSSWSGSNWPTDSATDHPSGSPSYAPSEFDVLGGGYSVRISGLGAIVVGAVVGLVLVRL